MHHSACRWLFALVALIGVVGLGSAADDADAVKEKLFQAKKEFDGEVKKFKQAVDESFDKREDTARAAGDKKTVDQIKAERDVFAKTGDLSATMSGALKPRVATARTSLDKAYTTAVKDYVRLKLDDAADVAEKERAEFLLTTAFPFGKRTFLSSVKAFDIRVQYLPFEKDSSNFKLKGETVPHTIFCHPDAKGEASVSYNISTKGVVAFRAIVGMPRLGEDQPDPASAAVLEVLGDGKSLWKSEPINTIDTFQTCYVYIEKVKTLTLRTHCGNPQHNRSVWLAPILIE